MRKKKDGDLLVKIKFFWGSHLVQVEGHHKVRLPTATLKELSGVLTFVLHNSAVLALEVTVV